MRLVCAVQIWGNKIMQRKTGGEVLYTLWLSCPRVLGELFMKVLTEEEQVQQGAFLWGATTADSQVGLGLSCGLWILMMVQWSRYANLQCSFSPVSAERRGCVQICNLCCGSAPSIFFPSSALFAPSLSLSVLPLGVSNCLPLTVHTFFTLTLHTFFILFLYTPPSAYLFLNCPCPLCTPTPHFPSHSSVSYTPLTLSLMIDSALKIM